MTFSTDDFQALCTELVAIEDALTGRAPVTANQGQALDGFSALAQFRDIAERARAALAQPETEPQGLTDDELDGLAAEAGLDLAWRPELRCFARFALARTAAAILQPIPVSKLWPWKLDCDAKGRCWWGDAGDDKFVPSWRLCEQPDKPCFDHWLPHWALPIPG